MFLTVKIYYCCREVLNLSKTRLPLKKTNVFLDGTPFRDQKMIRLSCCHLVGRMLSGISTRFTEKAIFGSRAMDIPYRSRGFVRYNLYDDSPFRMCLLIVRTIRYFRTAQNCSSRNSVQVERLQDLTSRWEILASPIKSSSLAVWHMKRCVGQRHNFN